MSKRHADSTPDEMAPNSTTLSVLSDEVLVEAARNGDTTAVQVGLEKLSPDTDSKRVAFDAVHEACRGNHNECLALLLPYVETTQMGFGILLSECIHADHTACTKVLLQHWKSVCSNVAFVPHGQEDMEDRACPAMWVDPAVCEVLIDAGADIETKDDMGRSPLHWACRSGTLEVVKMLHKQGAGVCVACNFGNSCLIFASYHGHTETVRYLVGLKDVDVNHTANYGWSALVCAVRQNHADVVQVLIDAGADIEARDEDLRTPLISSCKKGELPIVKMLVEAGAEVRAIDTRGCICLIMAAAFGHTETVRYLVGLPGIDVVMSTKEEDGYTAVLVAVELDSADVMKVLIDAGADIETKNNEGRSPLSVASAFGKLEVVKVLIRAGAKVCVPDNNGDTCLALAAGGGHTETVRTLLCMPEVDVNHSCDRDYTALLCAVVKKHSVVVQVLIDAGADIEVKDIRRRSPLHTACEKGELTIVKMLVEAGADVRVVDDKGNTCLIAAAAHGHTETVRYLVNLPKVDVNHRNMSRLTALDRARQKQHAGVERVISERLSN